MIFPFYEEAKNQPEHKKNVKNEEQKEAEQKKSIC